MSAPVCAKVFSPATRVVDVSLIVVFQLELCLKSASSGQMPSFPPETSGPTLTVLCGGPSSPALPIYHHTNVPKADLDWDCVRMLI